VVSKRSPFGSQLEVCEKFLWGILNFRISPIFPLGSPGKVDFVSYDRSVSAPSLISAHHISQLTAGSRSGWRKQKSDQQAFSRHFPSMNTDEYHPHIVCSIQTRKHAI
jgi:hypothetical protein